MTVESPPEKNKVFSITWPDGSSSQAVVAHPEKNAEETADMLGLARPSPTIFVTGGASYMTDKDKALTQAIIEEGIARFAQDYGVTLIDGGTESGVMHMIGVARRKHGYTFPLIGVAPLGRVEYPGYTNPLQQATLEDNHTHFVLVDAPDWGDESLTIVRLAQAISGNGQRASTGILINGGRISRQDVFFAIAEKMPILVLEGSGRFADELATAFRTGQTNQRLIQAIIKGGDIELVGTVEGPQAVYDKLAKRFGKLSN